MEKDKKYHSARARFLETLDSFDFSVTKTCDAIVDYLMRITAFPRLSSRQVSFNSLELLHTYNIVTFQTLYCVKLQFLLFFWQHLQTSFAIVGRFLRDRQIKKDNYVHNIVCVVSCHNTDDINMRHNNFTFKANSIQSVLCDNR